MEIECRVGVAEHVAWYIHLNEHSAVLRGASRRWFWSGTAAFVATCVAFGVLEAGPLVAVVGAALSPGLMYALARLRARSGRILAGRLYAEMWGGGGPRPLRIAVEPGGLRLRSEHADTTISWEGVEGLERAGDWTFLRHRTGLLAGVSRASVFSGNLDAFLAAVEAGIAAARGRGGARPS